MSRASSSDLVSRFGREVRGLQIDLRHERERRILTIRHSLEEELLEENIDIGQISSDQIDSMLEDLIPGYAAALTSSAEPIQAVFAAPQAQQHLE